MKTFSNFSGKLTVTHGEELLELVEITQSKGTKGIFPGVIASDKTTSDLINFIGSEGKFDQWVARRWNEETQLIWRDVCEDAGLEKTSVVSPEQSKLIRENFCSYLVDSLDGKRSVERDAAWYREALTKLNKALAKATEDKKPDEINRLKGELGKMKALYVAARAAEDELIRQFEAEILS